MDEVDLKIVEVLRNDARASLTDIAQEVDISESTVRNRLDRLREEEIEFSLDQKGRGNSCYIHINAETGADLDEIVGQMPKHFKADEVAGKYDIIVRGEESSLDKLNEKIDEIRSINGVKRTETYMVLKSA